MNVISVCLLHNELNNYDTVVIGYFTSSFAIATLSTTAVKYEDPFVAHLNLMLIQVFMLVPLTLAVNKYVIVCSPAREIIHELNHELKLVNYLTYKRTFML